MNEKRYSYIIYFITTVIALTLIVQLYWNYKNYESGKIQLKRDVQTSLDLAVDQYYEELATQNTLGILSDSKDGFSMYFDSPDFKRFMEKRSDSSKVSFEHLQIQDDLDSLGIMTVKGASPQRLDSILKTKNQTLTRIFNATHNDSSTIYLNKNSRDSIKTSRMLQNFFARQRLKKDSNEVYDTLPSGELRLRDRQSAIEALTTKIVISFNEDDIDIKKLDTLVLAQLRTLGIDRSAHSLSYSPKGDTVHPAIPGVPKHFNPTYDFNIVANSKLLPPKSVLSIGFNDITTIVLQRNLLGIFLSFLLVASIISSLFYLLKIIKDQKQLAEIKNDFISNITHEFKTPIATIGAALESIQHFNTSNDIQKTKKYVAMSSQQVMKLNTMVEKLLETATIDSDALELKKQETNIALFLEHIVASHQETLNGKKLDLVLKSENVFTSVDVFHLENALDNVIDNAIKYGGDSIKVTLEKDQEGIHIYMSDNGNSLTKTQSHQLFEKFYRVPKGNTHDIKGFGIGLYYTKTIIEKHGGTIKVNTSPTTFKTTLPYV